MRDPVAATYRGTGAATAEVGLHPEAGEGGRLFEKVTTLVQLHRYTNGWVPTGAKAAAPSRSPSRCPSPASSRRSP